MATTDILARDFTFETNTGTSGSPVWVEIGGLETWNHKPATTKAKTNKFANAGRASHLVATRGDTFTLKGLYQEDEANGNRDAGQEALETQGIAVGADSIKEFRITSPGGTVKTFSCSAEVTVGGGGDDDATSWECELEVSGAITVS